MCQEEAVVHPHHDQVSVTGVNSSLQALESARVQ